MKKLNIKIINNIPKEGASQYTIKNRRNASSKHLKCNESAKAGLNTAPVRLPPA